MLHLLEDVAVPAHVVPHKIGYMEFEHRSFEYEAGLVVKDIEAPLPEDEALIPLRVQPDFDGAR